MFSVYKPKIYVNDIYNINYKKLKDQGIEYLLFDIDNTISQTNLKRPNNNVQKLFDKLKKANFKIIILTNAIPTRAQVFAKILEVDAFSFSCKPLSFNYKRIMKKYKINSEKIAAIGDQIYTDIKGANKLNITSILVDPISSKEGILTKLNRVKEKRLINKINIIKRGEYYE